MIVYPNENVDKIKSPEELKQKIEEEEEDEKMNEYKFYIILINKA
jgi:hypothetical protein